MGVPVMVTDDQRGGVGEGQDAETRNHPTHLFRHECDGTAALRPAQ